MRHLLIYLSVVFLGLLSYLTWQNQQKWQKSKPSLHVYASSSFVSQWGPGPWLKESFEKTCSCQVVYHEITDTYLLLQKLRADRELEKVDVIMGLELADLELARTTLKWQTLDSLGNYPFNPLIKQERDQFFIPYDWSALAFVIRTPVSFARPSSLKDLAQEVYKDQYALIDPRTSSLGLAFLHWVYRLYGPTEGGELLKKISQNAKLTANSWSSAYGLFRNGQVPMVLSFVTSPIYHLIEEKNKSVEALLFTEGHEPYMEYMGLPEDSDTKSLAKQWVEFILQEESQKVLMNKNYMFPVQDRFRESSPFAELPPFKMLPATAELNSQTLIEWWSRHR
jgi:thiamine transport system substrate-binding protein